MLRIESHGTKLVELEDLCPSAKTILLKNRGTGRVDLNNQRDDQHRDRTHNQHKERYENIYDSFDNTIVNSFLLMDRFSS